MKLKTIMKNLIVMLVIGLIITAFSIGVDAATKYSITYYKGDGSGNKKVDSVAEGTVYAFKGEGVFTRTGYTQTKWNTKKDGSGTNYAFGKKITVKKNHTVYAQWKANKYTVYFEPCIGSVTTTSKTVTYASTYGTLPTPTRAGYTFKGWYTASSGGTKISSTTKVSNAKHHALYAQWTANKYTLSFNSMGGSAVSALSVTYDVGYPALPTPTRAGYTFIGWFASTNGSGMQIEKGRPVETANNHIAYAFWVPNKYVVTFNSCGGTISTPSVNAIYDSAYGTLPTPTRAGYTFKGWYTASTGGTQITSDTKMTTAGNHTLYAQWIEHTYTILYNSNYPETSKENEQPITKNTVYTATILLESESIFSFDGYHILSWNTRKDGKGIEYKCGDMTKSLAGSTSNGEKLNLYAIWKPNVYTIEYDANGGEGTAIESHTATYGETMVIPSNDFSKDGYVFMGWGISKDNIEETFDGTINLDWNMSKAADSNNVIKLYALWKPNSVTFEFDPINTTDTILDPITIGYDEKIENLPVPVYKKYDFLYWETEDGTKVLEGDINKFLNKNTVLYAVTKRKQVTVEFYDKKGGKLLKSQKIGIDSKMIELDISNPVLKNYLFVDWYVEEDGHKILVTESYKFTKDTKVYGMWSKVNKPKKIKKLKLKFVGKKLKVSFRGINADGYIIKFKYKGKTYKQIISAKKWKKSGKKLYKFFKKFPKTKKTIKKNQKIKVTVSAYAIDSTKNKIIGKNTSKLLKPKKKLKKKKTKK